MKTFIKRVMSMVNAISFRTRIHLTVVVNRAAATTVFLSLRKGLCFCVDLVSCSLQVLNESPNAARALDLIKQQEITKAAEHQRQQAEYAAYVKQMEVRVLPIYGT